MNNLASRVRHAVDVRNCKLIDLANAAGVKPPSVSGWLNGTTRTLKSATALRAAQFLRVNVLWLTEGAGPMLASESQHSPKKSLTIPIPDPPEIAEVLRLMRATDDRGRAMALGAVKVALAGHNAESVISKRCSVIDLAECRRVRMR